MKKHYITYDKANKSVVWGGGTNATRSLRDAKRNYLLFSNNHHKSITFATIQCDYSIHSFCDANGGYFVPWKAKNGVAYLDGYCLKASRKFYVEP